ncbi:MULTISPECIES: transposase domain-containing protein [Mesorhizobium]|uniref:transposase domain-containing protein n=1 Tax=Mesorhizobium TaxID=68287 RepID=UPI001F44BBC3|nr:MULTISPECIES: transposase domain-containing protein [Mesorhizobium]MCF6115101.1 transposase domain-containing protein [Mesorhizobium muleiense]
MNDVEPLGYLADVLTRIVNGHPNSQIDDLLPWAYIPAPELLMSAVKGLDRRSAAGREIGCSF